MKSTSALTLHASAQTIQDTILSASYLGALVEALDMVDQIEELERTTQDDTLMRRLRYRAPTASKIPSFLAKYRDKAPEHVYWIQEETWQLNAYKMSYIITPELPEHWHRYYSNSGSMVIAQGAGTCSVTTTLEFDVNVFGFKRMIERALEPEIKRLLDLQHATLAQAVAQRAQG